MNIAENIIKTREGPLEWGRSQVQSGTEIKSTSFGFGNEFKFWLHHLSAI